jgi:hypothetical protein
MHDRITIDLKDPPKKGVEMIKRFAVHTHLKVDIRAISKDSWETLNSRFPNAEVGEVAREFRFYHVMISTPLSSGLAIFCRTATSTVQQTLRAQPRMEGSEKGTPQRRNSVNMQTLWSTFTMSSVR